MARGGSGPPAAVAPMLATPDRGRLPDDERFAYEFKYDGYRAVLRVGESGEVALTSRNGNDITDEFAAVYPGLGAALGGRAAVLDGELVVLNEHGQPEFGLMQERRGRFQQGLPTAGLPARYLVFDLLRLGDRTLLDEPYDERRRLLRALEFPEPDLIAVVPAFTHTALTDAGLTPADLLGRAAAAGYEGLIAKRRSSRYHPGRRSPEWLKHPLIRTQEVIVCGWRPGKGRRDGGIGGLLLGAHDPATGDLVYLGDVGTGFSDRALRELDVLLAPLARRTAPFAAALAGRTPGTPAGWSRRWSARSSTGSSPAATAGCGTRPGGGCARTATRPRSSYRARPSARPHLCSRPCPRRPRRGPPGSRYGSRTAC